MIRQTPSRRLRVSSGRRRGRDAGHRRAGRHLDGTERELRQAAGQGGYGGLRRVRTRRPADDGFGRYPGSYDAGYGTAPDDGSRSGRRGPLHGRRGRTDKGKKDKKDKSTRARRTRRTRRPAQPSRPTRRLDPGPECHRPAHGGPPAGASDPRPEPGDRGGRRPGRSVSGRPGPGGRPLGGRRLGAVPAPPDRQQRRGRLPPPGGVAPGGAPVPAGRRAGGGLPPWLATPTGDHYVTKYTPVFPAFIALSHRVFGSDRAALALTAAGAVVACYLLAREVLGRRREAVLAAGFLAGSPLFAIQSATYLSYLFNLGLLMGFAAALLAGIRRRSRGSLALAGLLLGLAVFARPFDAVLFACRCWPGGVWRLTAPRSDTPPPGRVGDRSPAAGRGGLGRPRRPAADGGHGGVLPGRHREFPPAAVHVRRPGRHARLRRQAHVRRNAVPRLHPGAGVGRLGRLTVLTGFWGLGGLLLTGLAVVGYRGLRDGAGRWLALVALTVPVGYAFFWGSFSSSEWGGPWRFGPFYWLPVLVPGSILGGGRVRPALALGPAGGPVVAGGMAAVSLFVIVRAVADHRRYVAAAGPALRRAARRRRRPRPGGRVPPPAGRALAAPAVLVARNAGSTVRWCGPSTGAPAGTSTWSAHLPDRTPYRVVLPGRPTPRPRSWSGWWPSTAASFRLLGQGEKEGPGLEFMPPDQGLYFKWAGMGLNHRSSRNGFTDRLLWPLGHRPKGI